MERKTITRIQQINSSVNGNPRYRIGFDDATTAITASDYGFAYEIGNPGMRVGSTVGVDYTKRGRISWMQAYA